jgi:hypothetical protein
MHILFDPDDDPTGIDMIKNETLRTNRQGTSIFNLAGQRLQKPQRGLNIINDKKVVVVE